MKAKPQSFKSYHKLIVFVLLSITSSFGFVNAQCPTVTNSLQSLCDVQSVLVGDLQAIDNGGGIVWYESATSTVPLSNSESLISGEDYYADDASGSCSTRARVDVIIYGPPIGSNFQGICLDDPSLATVANLVAIGNNVQWYSTASGGTPLIDSTILVDNAIYYADQENPDTGCRTSRLAVEVNVGFTPVPTGDTVQEFCISTGTTPTISDLAASGNNNWYISLFSALPLPDNTPLVDGQIYYGTTVDLPCESTGRLAVIVILSISPDPGIDGVLDLCENDTNTPIDLFTALGGSPQPGGIWTPTLNSGTGVFDPNSDPDGVYTYTLTSTNSCPGSSATVNVTTYEAPNAGTDGTLDICSNSGSIDLFNSLGGTPDIGGTWSPALNNGTGIFDPAVDPQGIYTYSVNGIPPCDTATATVSVSVTLFNDAGENGTIEICDNNGTVNLFDSLGGTPDLGGTWSPTLNSGTGIFDPLVDAQGTYTYSFLGNTICPPSSATVTITVNELPDAGTDALLELCSSETNSVDLFNSLGGNPDAGGLWSPALASGTGLFDPSVDAPGIYTYSFIGIAPCPDASSTVEVSIVQEADAGSDATVDICNNNGTIDLFDSLGGTPDIGGTWSPALNSGTGIFDPEIDAEGTYTYTVLGTIPCPDTSATITISVSPFLDAGENGALTICTTDGIVDLFDSLGGTPDSGGTWSPALNSGTGIFDPTIDPEGTYTYSISSGGTCPNDSATVVVSVEQEPNAGGDGILNLCGSTDLVNLFDSLTGTPDAGGTWSPILNSSTGIFNPNTDPEGTYTYTINSVCGTDTSSVTVSFTDENDAGSDGFLELCFNDSSIDLFNSLGGTPQIGGTWIPALNSGTGIFDPSIDSPGAYTYVISNNASLCPSDFATVIVTVLPEPNAGTDGVLNLCNATDAVDLFNSLAGTPQTGGTWTPELSSGTGLFNPNIDPEGIYTYTINSPCGTSSANVSVSFTDLNDAGIDGSVELCSSDAPIDLFEILGGSPQLGGTWSPALNSGTGIFDPSSDSSDTYTYTISNSTSLCPDDSATVTVTLLQEPNAGTDGTLNLCNATNTVDLFDSLAGTPDTGGTWSPALSSGTGVFDPNVDAEGVYTYALNTICGSSSATVTVSFSELNDAGNDGSIDLCSDSVPVDLFDSLGGTPQLGGTWSPTLNSGSGIFDPLIDSAGIYTYTLSNAATLCPDDSATVTVSLSQTPDAGTDSLLLICSNDLELLDLFDFLDGTPDTGGTWSPSLNSGTGIFDPAIDTEGFYTYTISSICGDASATLFVSFTPANDAGTSSSLELCSNDSAVDLFDSLGGTPQTGGTWSPALSSGTGIFDPSLDTGGTYTYTVTNDLSTCPEANASVTVTIIPVPDAGIDNTLNLCTSDTDLVDLFDSLGGTPDTGGTWSPALNSGTGVFNPAIDLAGSYTYSVNSPECNLTDEANVTVVINETPDASGLTMTVDESICIGSDAIVSITGANLLADGDYTIVFQLSESNTSLNTTDITVTGGNASFTITEDLLQNPGTTIITLSQLFFLGENCSANTELIEPVKVLVISAPTPEIIDNGAEFCDEDNATIENLTANLIDSSNIIWYNQPQDGDAYDSSELLQDGQTYYASGLTEEGCESQIRLEVTVSIISCVGDLLIPDGFSPNNDGINDVFDILFLNDLYPNFKLSIFNRYGDIIYEGDINTPKWDGTWKGNNNVLPIGVYFYILEFNDGERDPEQGRVYLSR